MYKKSISFFREGEYIRSSINCVNKIIPGIKENIDKYSRGKIYKIFSDHTDKIYIGSTTQTLERRYSEHKYKYNNQPNKPNKYTKFNDIFKYNDAKIELIEQYPTTCEYFLHLRERFYIESMKCINKNIPTRTDKEYKEANKIKYKIIRKNYNKKNTQNNKENIKQYFKKYREDNPEKVKTARKMYDIKNRERIAQRTKEYNQKHKERKRICYKLYCIKNKEKISIRHKLYNYIHKEKIKNQRKIYIMNNKEKIKEQRRNYYKNKLSKKLKTRVNCNICGKEVNKGSLSHHKQIHNFNEQGKNKRQLESKKYREKNKDLISARAKQRTTCGECGKEINKKSLYEHKKTHIKEKITERVKCDECGKEMNKTSLCTHKKIHLNKELLNVMNAV